MNPPQDPDSRAVVTSSARSYVIENDRERERLRALVARLGDAELGVHVNQHWTIAGVLAHVAFWDARQLVLIGKLERDEPFTSDDVEPDDATWINDSVRPLAHAIAPREAARLAVRLADETDARIAAMAPGRLWPNDPTSLVIAFRSEHRAEHLDEIEAALQKRSSP
jgi:sulfite reductase beta subunit-like hemoprotein